ncbi:MAG: SIS domain-containing protein [Acidobacteria bacterium]|nr:MAG: SIS domain-containing protein [Acidobacteriota bacterium]
MPAQEQGIDARLTTYLENRVRNSKDWQEICASADGASRSKQGASTPREILQQPWVWRESGALVADRLDDLAKLLNDVSHIYLTGAGSSFYVGKCLETVLQQRLGRPVSAIPSTDLILAPERRLKASARGLVISFSRSGRSPESFEVTRAVSESFPSYQQLLITCDLESQLSQHFSATANTSVLGVHPAACDKGLAMTSSFTSMVIAGQALAFLGQAEGYREHVNGLATLGAQFLDHAAAAVNRVKLNQIRRACVLGNGVLHGAALEGALKMLELTDGRISTLAETFLGVRHGPLSFVDSQTFVIYFVSSHPTTRKYEKDLMQEVRDKQLGYKRLAVGCRLSELDGLFEGIDLACVSGYQIPDDLRPPLDVILPQVLAIKLSLALGFDVDNPSNRGAISRVVQGVTIHEA